MQTYMTFGQGHTHKLNGKTVDKDTVLVIEAESENAARKWFVENFNDKFCSTYPRERWNAQIASYYPGGYVTALTAPINKVKLRGFAVAPSNDMFATYETVDELLAYAHTLTGSERTIALTFIHLTINTLAHIEEMAL